MYRSYYRRNLPHYQPDSGTLFVTCRRHRLIATGRRHPPAAGDRLSLRCNWRSWAMTLCAAEELYAEYRRAFGRFDRALDRARHWSYLVEGRSNCQAHGRCIAPSQTASNNELIAFCIMLNHLHIVFTPLQAESGEPVALETIMHSYKRYTAQQANKVLQREGEFWQHESYDHVARNADELERIVAYVADNPVKAGLVRAKGCVAVDLREGAVERDDISLSRARLGLASEMASRFTSIWQLSAGVTCAATPTCCWPTRWRWWGQGDAGPWRAGRSDGVSTAGPCGCLRPV